MPRSTPLPRRAPDEVLRRPGNPTARATARSRAKHEQRYDDQLRAAVLKFLDFAPAHRRLAEQIATGAAAHAAVIGSGRVGRTQLLTLEDKARLATRAHLRHRYTGYEDELDKLPLDAWGEDDLYREVKGSAHGAVDDFLVGHRQR